MITNMISLLENAAIGKYAVGAFNIYNLEGAKAVIEAAEMQRSPVILQVHPNALEYGGSALIAMCIEMVSEAKIQGTVHLDHCNSLEVIKFAIEKGIDSVMADGSKYLEGENITFTSKAGKQVHKINGSLEAELGYLAGSEDGLNYEKYNAKLTDPEKAIDFVKRTKADALAVCIGNVHGAYRQTPKLDFERLKEINKNVKIPLVLHGASGLPEKMVSKAIRNGIVKMNVNTELRNGYLFAIEKYQRGMELLGLLYNVVWEIKQIAANKMALFGSSGKS